MSSGEMAMSVSDANGNKVQQLTASSTQRGP